MSAISDPIADLLTRVRNAGRAGRAEVSIPHSKMKNEITRILKAEGYISDFTTDKEGTEKSIKIVMRYDRDDAPVIRGLRRVSKPGLRRYVESTKIPRVLNGMGIAILSTSKGILSDKDARKQKIGGELLAFVW
jgi:small subunit ribosomal protein S8